MNRISKKKRETKETKINVILELDGGNISIDTGIGFFDHMLNALCLNAGWGLKLEAKGDLDVDGHHTVEDVGIVLGLALHDALDSKTGIERYGSAYVPMDEALGFCAVDISGRSHLSYDSNVCTGGTGLYDFALTKEFFRAFSANAGITLHIKSNGENAHHIAEAAYKAVGRALRTACMITGEVILSTKGVID